MREVLGEEQVAVFEGLTFMLCREVPVDSLEFVLLCGGANVLREDQLDDDQTRSHTVTHQVMDRPTLKHNILSREYVQPQWVYDSINSLCLLPTEPYKPGVVPPPHLSPFVNDEEEGYVPEQRKVLAEWGAKGYGASKLTVVAEDENKAEEDNEDNEDEEEDEEEATEESKYNAELALERAGVKFSEKQGDADEEDEGDEGDEGDEDEGDEGDEEEVASAPKKRTRAEREKDLAKTMMNKKDARLYSKMQYGINKKKEAVDLLKSKRQKIEKSNKKKKSKK